MGLRLRWMKVFNLGFVRRGSLCAYSTGSGTLRSPDGRDLSSAAMVLLPFISLAVLSNATSLLDSEVAGFHQRRMVPC